MNVDTSRTWPPTTMVINHTQQPPLNHESHPFPQQHPDPNLAYPPPPQQQDQQYAMARGHPPYDVTGHNAPLTYPPPPPPGGAQTRGSPYGQAPQGPPYPPPPSTSASASTQQIAPAASRRRDGRASPKPESYYAPNAAELYNHAQMISNSPSPGPEGSESSVNGKDHYSSSVPRLPPILQVEKQQVTTSATQAASASRRRNEAHFVCPVPGCGSTFTRRFNLRGSLGYNVPLPSYIVPMLNIS